MKTRRIWGGVAAAVCMLVGAAALAHPHPDQPNLEEILDGLERGMVALEQLDRPHELEMLRGVADEVRRRMQADRAVNRHGDGRLDRIEIMRLALPALREADRRDAADLIERAIHALQMDVQGRRDHESAMIRNNAPGVGDQIEILQMASGLWREFGHDERAVMVGELAERMAAESRRGRRPEQPRPRLRDEDRRRLEELREQFDRLEQAVEELRRRLANDDGR